MAHLLLKYMPMACATRTNLVVRVARLLAILMIATTFNSGCPFPVQYPLTPDPENEPPVINPDYTDPYIVRANAVEEKETPIFTIVVDDPNADDELQVKVIRNVQLTWLPTEEQHDILMQNYIEPLDMLPPEDASNMGVSATTRRAEIELERTPCVEGSRGQQVFLWVCVTDRSWDPPPTGHPNENPCIPRDGFVDTYPVIVNCIEPQD